MRYNRYLYRLSVQTVPITTDILKNSILVADIIANPIISTSLMSGYNVSIRYNRFPTFLL